MNPARLAKPIRIRPRRKKPSIPLLNTTFISLKQRPSRNHTVDGPKPLKRLYTTFDIPSSKPLPPQLPPTKKKDSSDFLATSFVRPRAHTVLVKHSTVGIKAKVRVDFSNASRRKSMKTPLSGNAFISLCEEFMGMSMHKSFYDTLPEMLERRFKKILGPAKKTSRAVLSPANLMTVMKSSGFGDMLAERVRDILATTCKKLTQTEFASLLLERLACNKPGEQLKFCFDVLDISNKGYLDCIGLYNWLQGDAEPLLRNDLFCICKLFKNSNIFGKNLHKPSGEERKIVRESFEDLGLWGYACGKSSFKAVSRNIPFKTCQGFRTHELYEDYINVPEEDKITFLQYRRIKFGNKGLPDLLFIVIQLIYGVEICDAYCNYVGVKLFRPFRDKGDGTSLKRIYALSNVFLQRFR